VGAYRLGLSYARGLGLTRDVERAVSWLRLAARAGERGAAAELGVLMARDPRFPPQEAAAWSKQAARQGLASAQYNFAILCMEGRGVERDLRAARGWFERAARQGDGSAQFNLAIMAGRGIGGVQRLGVAWFWARLAAENEVEGARDLLEEWDDAISEVDREDAEQAVRSWIERREQSHRE
jgi:TPR repeat protein